MTIIVAKQKIECTHCKLSFISIPFEGLKNPICHHCDNSVMVTK
jgi:hypothetical protein